MINNKKILITYRKFLRNNSTPAEIQLWTYIKNRQLSGRKFRRQHSIDNFILDFYCPAEKLAVELDGGYHNTPKQSVKDKERDLILKFYGIKVLRFRNELVFQNIDGVLVTIRSEFRSEE
jgi:very-short-patch-repair endonuclease